MIAGQIDGEMAQTVCRILKIKRTSFGSTIMGSTSIETNFQIWSLAIAHKTKDLDILWLVSHAKSEVQAVARGRNDFVHAVYYERLESGAYTFSSSNEYAEIRPDSSESTFAQRIKTGKRKSVTELAALRDKAARLSCLIAHIGRVIAPHKHQERDGHSPWLGRLASSLPPRPDTWLPAQA